MCKLSILMPVYNEEQYVFDAVKSVVTQNCDSFELIVVDDGSTDRTLEILETVKSSKLRVFHFGKIGKNAAINKAYQMARGDWIVFFAGDDIMPANSLKARYEAIRHFDPKDLVVGLSRLEIMSENKRYDGII